MQSLTAPHRYTKLPGSADLVYRSICLSLSDRMEQVDTSTTLSTSWASFNPDDWELLGNMAEREVDWTAGAWNVW